MDKSPNGKWQKTQSQIKLENNNKRRRIEFKLASHKPLSARLTSSDQLSSRPIDAALAVKTKNGAIEDKISGPSPGLYSPEAIVDNINWTQIKRVGPGLFNHGNTCFLNSTLQCLLYIPPLVQLLLKDKTIISTRTTNHQRTILEIFQRFVEEAGSPNCGKVISPRGMVSNIKLVSKQFRPMRQEDAHEYLRQLLDCMHENILKSKGYKISDGKISETTFISRVFGGYLCNELKCPKCQYSSKTYNHFQDLSLDILQGIKSVSDAIATFIKPEQLGSGNEWQCGGCSKRVQAKKQMTVARAPNVLVLHLKRFSFVQGSGKIGKHVDFENGIQLPCSEEPKKLIPYSLHGIIVHHGGSVHSGHYVAYIKSPSGEWTEMNDAHVHVVSISTVLKQQAYLLFYVRSDLSKSICRSPPKPSISSAKDSSDVQNKLLGAKRKIEETEKNTYSEDDVGVSEERSVVVGKTLTQSIIAQNNRLTRRRSFIIMPFRFRGKLDPFFIPSKKPTKQLRFLYNEPINHEVSDLDNSSSSDTSIKKKRELPHENLNIPENPVSDANSVNAKGKTIVRELIDLGKRGAEIGSEGFWDGTVDRMSLAISEDQKKNQRKLLRSREPGEWNSLLDRGRVKKIKVINEEFSNGASSSSNKARDSIQNNPFQHFQDGAKKR